MFSYKCHLIRRLIYLNEKFLHATQTRAYSDFNKNKKSNTNNNSSTSPTTSPITSTNTKHESSNSTPVDLKKKHLKSFSFIEVKPDSFQPLKDKTRSRFHHSVEQEPENVQHQINELIKQQESIANKLAKLIDKLEPSKTAEKLLGPVVEVKKRKQLLNETLELSDRESFLKLEKKTEQKPLEQHDNFKTELDNKENLMRAEKKNKDLIQKEEKTTEHGQFEKSEQSKAAGNKQQEKYSFYILY